MCGRFTNTRERAEVEQRFAARLSGRLAERYAPRFNVAPTQRVVAVRAAPEPGEREAVGMRWGLLPHWAKDERASFRMINAKAETLPEKHAFRGLLARHRCLVPADGFYEWAAGPDGKRQPLRFTLLGGGLFAFAGLWTSRTDEATGEVVESCTIVTTRPNDLVAPVHDRMPVILPPGLEAEWLDPETSREYALSLLTPYPAELMHVMVASRRVGDVRNDDPSLLAPDLPGLVEAA